jgi:hypothetical protein
MTDEVGKAHRGPAALTQERVRARHRLNAAFERFDELVHSPAASARMHDKSPNACEQVFDAVIELGDQ